MASAQAIATDILQMSIDPRLTTQAQRNKVYIESGGKVMYNSFTNSWEFTSAYSSGSGGGSSSGSGSTPPAPPPSETKTTETTTKPATKEEQAQALAKEVEKQKLQRLRENLIKLQEARKVAEERAREVSESKETAWVMGPEGQEQLMGKEQVIGYYENKASEIEEMEREVSWYITASESPTLSKAELPPDLLSTYLQAIRPSQIEHMDLDYQTKSVAMGVGGIIYGLTKIPVGIGEYIAGKIKHPETLGEVPMDIVAGPIEWGYSLTQPDRPITEKIGEIIAMGLLIRGRGGKPKTSTEMVVESPKVLDIVLERGGGTVWERIGEGFKLTDVVLRTEAKVITDFGTQHFIADYLTRGVERGTVAGEIGGVIVSRVEAMTPKRILGQKGISDFIETVSGKAQSIKTISETIIPFTKYTMKGKEILTITNVDLGVAQGVTLTMSKNIAEGVKASWIGDYVIRAETPLDFYVGGKGSRIAIPESIGVEKSFIDRLGGEAFRVTSKEVIFKVDKTISEFTRYDIQTIKTQLETPKKPVTIKPPKKIEFSEELLQLGKATKTPGLELGQTPELIIIPKAPVIDIATFEKITLDTIMKEVSKQQKITTKTTITKEPGVSMPVMVSLDTPILKYPSTMPEFPTGKTEIWVRGVQVSKEKDISITKGQQIPASLERGAVDTGAISGINEKVGQIPAQAQKVGQQQRLRQEERMLLKQETTMAFRPPRTPKLIDIDIPSAPKLPRAVIGRQYSEEVEGPRKKKGKRISRGGYGSIYIPSLTAQAFNIKSFSPPKNLYTGIEIRPIMAKKKKKKKK